MASHRAGLVSCFAALLLSGCFSADLDKARSQFYGGDPGRAADTLKEAADSDGRNQVLYLLERGTMLQAAGKIEESTGDFLDAVRLIREREIRSASAELFSLWYSDVVRPYRAEPYEKVLARAYLMMDYFLLRQPWEALVEARNAVRFLDDPQTPKFAQDPFTRYLSALAFDLGGHPESAYIEYKKVQALQPAFPYVKAPLLRLARQTGRGEDRARWLRLSGPETDRKPGHGMLVVFLQTGRGPEKVERTILIPPYYRISLPAFERRGALSAKGEARAGPAGASTASGELTDVESVAVKTLEDRTVKEVARETIRQGANEAVARALQKNQGDVVSLAERIAYIAIHQADTRAWETLPARLQVAQTLLPAGLHTIEIRFLSPTGGVVKAELRPGVEIREGCYTFINARAF